MFASAVAAAGQQDMQGLVQADVEQLRQQWRQAMLRHMWEGAVDIWQM
jgi:hypothetical protein